MNKASRDLVLLLVSFVMLFAAVIGVGIMSMSPQEGRTKNTPYNETPFSVHPYPSFERTPYHG